MTKISESMIDLVIGRRIYNTDILAAIKEKLKDTDPELAACATAQLEATLEMGEPVIHGLDDILKSLDHEVIPFHKRDTLLQEL